MLNILPGILAYTETDFQEHMQYAPLRTVAPMFHIDILDGTLVHAQSWGDPQTIAHWGELPDIELHCMVNDPLTVAQDWHKHIPTLKRVIVHQEIGARLKQTLAELRTLNLQIALAVNPKTPVDHARECDIDSLMIMGVEPGKSGQTFLGEPILAKIRRARSLFPNLPLAVDGGVSLTTIRAIAGAGANRCVATSALWKAENPVEAYQELFSKI
jgi:ribulose-phosphate 3-epimerase